MQAFLYNSLIRDTFRGRIDFEANDFKVMLVGNGYRPDKENDTRRSDVTNEVGGIGYDAGGVSVGVNVSVAGDGGLTISLGSMKLPNASVSARYAVYFVDRGDAAADELIACIDFGSDVTSTNADWQLTPSTISIKL